ncbi:GntG family PLP-dependent aldolase [Allokutzneria multivorans]|uniref:threonine aldolase family protein n=1 Tax=Allokutzneria multivorans TaxID=1142134 RepID=UPI0031EF6CC7
MSPVDLRSDTVTRPDERMRSAMATAEVGDDVLDVDPTMRRLEERAADLLGVAAALWVPTGCMGNTIALMTHIQRGDSFLAVRDAHVINNELGTPAWLAGGMPQALPELTPEAVRAATLTAGPYYSMRTSLLCVENTHNAGGGTVLSPEAHARLVAVAKELGLAVHLDGARVWNAAVATGVSPAELTAGVDTVQACLSKGLGAPMGSVVGGSADFVAEARRIRKMLGGGVRQGGVVAAAGLVALERIEDLAVDHENARVLADGLAELGWRVRAPETNIVLAEAPEMTVPAALERLTELKVLAGPMAGLVRFVTHRDVGKADVDEVLNRMKGLAWAGSSSTTARS